MSTCYPQVRQVEQLYQLSSVFHQASKAHFRITKLTLDHLKWMLNLGANLSIGSLDLAYCFVQHAELSVLPVDPAPGYNLPDDLAFSMLFALPTPV